MRKILLLPVLLILGALLFGCAGQQSPGQAGPLTAQMGDNVTIDYVLSVDGHVWATSISDVATKAGIYNASMNYRPLSFQLLAAHGLIPGLVNNVVGMKVGESKNFSIPPEEGFGPVNESKVFNISRDYNISRFQEVPMGYFVTKNITVKIGTTLPYSVGNVTIYDFTNDTVTLMQSVDAGQRFTLSGLPQEVVDVTNDTIFIRFDIVAGDTYNVTDPVSGATMVEKATYVDGQRVVLDGNNPLAGKTLDVQVTLRSLAR